MKNVILITREGFQKMMPNFSGDRPAPTCKIVFQSPISFRTAASYAEARFATNDCLEKTFFYVKECQGDFIYYEIRKSADRQQ